MRFIKKILINNYQIYIDIKSKYIINKNGLIFFGNPIINNLDELNSNNLKNYIHFISGFFLCISIKDNKLIIYNDVAGNFRMYYRVDQNRLFISDNYKKLLKKNKINIDIEQLEFWKNKNYTIGSRTLYKEIKKIPPASKTEFFKDKLKHSIYFNSLKIQQNSTLTENLKKNLEKNLNIFKNENKRNILLFSGGKDSSLLAQLLVDNKIKFTAVFINTIQKVTEIEKNRRIAKLIAKKNNFKLDEIKINLNTKKKSSIINYMMFDFHFSIIHFEGVRKIKKKYGKNINLICGQSADSIFSYGATANTLSHFISRISYFHNNFILSYPIKKVLENKYKIKLLNFRIKKEILFFLSFYYYLFIEKKLYEKSKNIINEVYDLEKKIINKSDYFMYLKIFGFLQGSDNQVVINACKHNSINCFLPYLDPQIIYSTIRKKNSFKDIFYPKYAVNELLKESFKNKILNFKKYKKNKFLLKNIEEKLKKEFLIIIKKK